MQQNQMQISSQISFMMDVAMSLIQIVVSWQLKLTRVFLKLFQRVKNKYTIKLLQIFLKVAIKNNLVFYALINIF